MTAIDHRRVREAAHYDLTTKCVAQLAEAGTALADAILAEGESEIAKSELLEQLVGGMMGMANPRAIPLKDGTVPLHSATSAEAAAKSTEQYRAAQREHLQRTFATARARWQYECAKICARAAVKEDA